MNETERMEFDKQADIVYGTILVIITVLGAPGNALSLYYFSSKRRDVSAIIYISITAVDTVLCLCSFPIALTYFSSRNPTLFASSVFCNLWHLVYKTLSSMSIFCVATLSITRTFFLLRPFKTISKNLVAAILVSYFLFQCVASTIIYWEKGGQWIYNEMFAECSQGSNVTKFEKLGDAILNLCHTFPIFPILMSCVVSIFALMGSAREGRTVEQGKEKRYASVTIVMFTVIYAVFNIPSSLLNLVNLFNSSLLWEEMLGFDKLGYFSNFVWSLSIPLNSFCNPILYIIRMKNLREAMLTLVTGGLYNSKREEHTCAGLKQSRIPELV
ncbi:hypothetical protein ACHWQZ_G015846 [Mnemiopsis leidyi]